MKNWRNLVKFAFQRVVIVSLCLAVQLVVLIMGVRIASGTYRAVTIVLEILSTVVVLYILSVSRTGGAYKLVWAVTILALPVMGILLYLLFGGKRQRRKKRLRLDALGRLARSELKQDPAVLEQLEQTLPEAALNARYVLNAAGNPVYASSTTRYFSPIEDAFPSICEALERAEHYIFLEYFIVEHGTMWDKILEILKRKVQQGVKVQLMYDDFGCIRRLPMHYARTLAEYGIRAIAFNPYIPVLSSRLNNRDHRKLMIVDGKTAFTGGFNLADEYMNAIHPFGYWKDSALQVEGAAAWSMTVQFLMMWKLATGEDCTFSRFRPPVPESPISDGFVQPYCDMPLEDEQLAENVYLSVIRASRRSLRIMTPYLVIDEMLMQALCTAAKSGVDVRIMTPGIPDKRYIHALTRAYYGELIEAGVRIYEYAPGFLHSKVMLADETVAVVGTINLDFRSLYLHYENAVLLYGTESTGAIAADMEETLTKSEEYTLARVHETGPVTRVVRALLRIAAPLM